MRLTLSLAALAALACTTSAQERLRLNPGKLQFTSRGVVPGSANGEALQRYGPAFLRGLGDAGGSTKAATISRHFLIWQDQNRGTTEPVYAVCRKAAKAGGPDPAAGAWFWKMPFKHPGGTGKGAAAWATTLTFKTPPSIPFAGKCYAGLGFPPNKLWTKDGVSLHTHGFSFGKVGDDPRGWGSSTGTPKAPNPAWNINLTAKKVSQPSGRIWRQALDVQGPVVRSGALIKVALNRGNNPNWGWAGYHLDVGSRADGQALQIRDAKNAGGAGFVVAGSPGPRVPGSKIIPGTFGSLYINPGGMILIGSKLGGLSKVQTFMPAFLAQGKIPPAISGSIRFQAVTAGPAGFRVSNAIDVTYD